MCRKTNKEATKNVSPGELPCKAWRKSHKARKYTIIIKNIIVSTLMPQSFETPAPTGPGIAGT